MKRYVMILIATLSAIAVLADHRAVSGGQLSDKRDATAEGQCEKGKAFLESGNLVEAEKAFKKAIEFDKSFLAAYQSLGTLYAAQNRIADAINMFKAARIIAPNRGDFLYNIGLLQTRQGKISAAIASYEEAIDVGLSNPALYHNLALLYSRLDHIRKAISLYKKAIELEPNNAMLHYDLAVDYQKLNQDDNALVEYQKALLIKPSSPPFMYGLANCYIALFRYDEAQRELKKLSEVAPNFQGLHLLLGETYFFQNRLREAESEFLKATRYSPKQHIVRFRLGQIYDRQGKERRARQEYKRAIALNPSEPSYHYRLGAFLLRIGKRREARKELAIYDRLYRKEMSKKKKMLSEELPLGGKYGGRGIISPTVQISPNNSNLSKLAGQQNLPSANGSAQEIHFTDVAEIAGIRFRHYNDRPSGEPATILETTGSGVAFCDYDGDGDLDIYFVNGSRLIRREGERERINLSDQPMNYFYENLGDGSFRDVTDASRAGDTGYGMGCVFGDYDNDGDDDLYVTNYGMNKLYRNNGDGTFTDVTGIAGVGDERFGTGCSFTDYNNDGLLDLYVANYVDYRHDGLNYCYSCGVKTGCAPWRYDAQSDVLYRNNGDGTFTDVTRESGIYKIPGASGRGLGVATGDYDLDGDADIYIANDATANFLFKNNGDGTFTDVALESGTAVSEAGLADSGMGVDFQDYDNDGRLDLLITNFQDLANTLYHNEGTECSTPSADVSFIDMSFASGIGTPTLNSLGFGIKFLDCNNDGYLDIFVANGHVLDNIKRINSLVSFKQRDQLFLNKQDGSFVEVPNNALDLTTTTDAVEAESLKAGRGAASGDYDNDGDTDIVVSNSNDTPYLLRNDRGNRNSFLMIKLIGRESNRNAIGAQVRLTAGSITQLREVQSGASYLSHSDWRLLFGLGHSSIVKLVEIRWPTGETQTFSDLVPNRIIIIMEGRNAPVDALPLEGIGR